MPRRLRLDLSGLLHPVMNRGIAPSSRHVMLALTPAEYARRKRLAIDDDETMASLARRWVLERLGRVPR